MLENGLGHSPEPARNLAVVASLAIGAEEREEVGRELNREEVEHRQVAVHELYVLLEAAQALFRDDEGRGRMSR